MKVAVISDIHANFQALEAVMNDIKSQGCEKVFCLGDIAMAGPQPRMSIDFVRNKNDWTVIQGNTDKMIAEYTPNLYNTLKEIFPVMANALKDDIEIIEDDKKDFLKHLPEQRKLVIEGVKVLLVHGSPRRNNEDILPNMPVEEVEKIIEGVEEDVIFCGHTHVPCGYQLDNNKTVVNVGSVGRPMTKDGRACYVVAEFKNGKFSVEHRLVDYDRDTAASIVRSRNFEGSNELAEMILHPKERHI